MKEKFIDDVKRGRSKEFLPAGHPVMYVSILDLSTRLNGINHPPRWTATSK